MTATERRAPRWRNRIVRARVMVSPRTLLANPGNWRAHPDHQKAFMQGSLDDLGWIDSVTVQDETDLIINGHMRVALALLHNEPSIPVDYVDLSDAEATVALAAIDQIPAYAQTNPAALDKLYQGMHTANAQLGQLFGSFADYSGLYKQAGDGARALLDHQGASAAQFGNGHQFPPPEPGEVPPPPAAPPAPTGATRDLAGDGSMPEHDAPPDPLLVPDTEPGALSDGSLLALIDVTIAEPRQAVATGEVWRLGDHVLAVVNPFRDWPIYVPYLTSPAHLLIPYPGPFVPVSLMADRQPLVMVQPDHYVAGHLLDHWRAVTGSAPTREVAP